MEDGWLSSHYHSLQVGFNRHFANGLLIKGQYTHSKAIDWADDDGRTGLLFNWTPMLPRNQAQAGFDVPDNFQAAFVYELPFKQKGAAWSIVRDWQLNGIFSAYSGTPFTVTASGASLNAPGNSQTADQVLTEVKRLGGVGPNTPYYDPLAFRSVTDVRFGSTGRNILRGPGVVNMNLSVFRSFPLTERFTLQFRAESYNLANSGHFTNPGANVSNMRLNADGSIASLGNFLSITGAQADQRQFRFGLRLSF